MAERILYLERVVGSLGPLDEEDMEDADVEVGTYRCWCWCLCMLCMLQGFAWKGLALEC
jgi:hypothetical protein